MVDMLEKISERDFDDKYRKVSESIDVIILWFVFLGLILIADNYRFRTGLFPLTFLIVGLLALTSEFLIEVLLPSGYRERVKRYTTGMADNVEESMLEHVGEEQSAEGLGGQTGVTVSARGREAILFASIIAYGLLAYLIGFIIATPLFVFGTIYLIGSQSFFRALGLTIALLIAIYILFGLFLNTPVLSGALFRV